MSTAPRPCTTPSSIRPGMLPCAGTVSKWPGEQHERALAALGDPGEDARVAGVADRDAGVTQHAEDVRGQGVLVARLGRDVDELERPDGEARGEVVGHGAHRYT